MTTEQWTHPNDYQVPLNKTPQHVFLDRWINNSIEIDIRAITRLKGEFSLYQAYCDACQELNHVPLSVRVFTRRLETLLEFHFGIASTKTRD